MKPVVIIIASVDGRCEAMNSVSDSVVPISVSVATAVAIAMVVVDITAVVAI